MMWQTGYAMLVDRGKRGLTVLVVLVILTLAGGAAEAAWPVAEVKGEVWKLITLLSLIHI